MQFLHLCGCAKVQSMAFSIFRNRVDGILKHPWNFPGAFYFIYRRGNDLVLLVVAG